MSGQEDAHKITTLLRSWSDGDAVALEHLTPLVYHEIYKIARREFRRESGAHLLQPTAVVNELFLHLLTRRKVDWQDRVHFFGFAAQQIRRILVDHARKNMAQKRGSDFKTVSLEDAHAVAIERRSELLLRLDDALHDLAAFNPEGSRIVEFWVFGGLNHDEIARLMGVSTPTVRNRWRAVRIWLHRELDGRWFDDEKADAGPAG